jgi:hypothetical protein
VKRVLSDAKEIVDAAMTASALRFGATDPPSHWASR